MISNFIVIGILLIGFLVYTHFGYKSNAELNESSKPAMQDEYKQSKQWRRVANWVAVIVAVILSILNVLLWK